MKTVLLIIQVISSVLLVILIMMQNKEGGLSAMMGGGESFHATRRGAEKVIFNITIIVAILFVANALLFVLI